MFALLTSSTLNKFDGILISGADIQVIPNEY